MVAPDCITVKRGMLWALPGEASWRTNDVAAPAVKVNDVATSTAASGTLAAAKGATVVLYDGEVELDRVVVP